MKIEQVIVLHLFNYKEVTLQGIGTFRLKSSVSLPTESEKDIVIPVDDISFDYNPKATEDVALIDSIVKHTTKIKPLASADLDSFLMLGRQFLNIGKPFVLDKLGTLDKAQSGTLIFIAGQFITPKIEAPKALKENENEESSGLFNDYNREPENDNRRIIFAVVAIVVLALLGWAVYHFAFAKKSSVATGITPGAVIADTTPAKDTNTGKPVNNNLLPEAGSNDNSINVIIKQTRDKNEAIKFYNRFTRYGHRLVITTDDSTLFNLEEIVSLPLTDSAMVRDSLSKFYNTPVTVKLK